MAEQNNRPSWGFLLVTAIIVAAASMNIGSCVTEMRMQHDCGKAGHVYQPHKYRCVHCANEIAAKDYATPEPRP